MCVLINLQLSFALKEKQSTTWSVTALMLLTTSPRALHELYCTVSKHAVSHHLQHEKIKYSTVTTTRIIASGVIRKTLISRLHELPFSNQVTTNHTTRKTCVEYAGNRSKITRYLYTCWYVLNAENEVFYSRVRSRIEKKCYWIEKF